MKIKTKETFEQTHKENMERSSANGTVDYLSFKKNGVYQFFIVPKVISINLAEDECEIDYPFEELNTHFGLYKFMSEYGGMKAERINTLNGNLIQKWMQENRVPKSVFKTAVGTKFFLTYVINEKKIKIAWFQDYLYEIYTAKLSKLMTDKDLNLIDAFRHRVKLFTNSEGKFDIEIDESVAIPTDSEGFKKVLVSVHEKPLAMFIEQQIITDDETLEKVVAALKRYNAEVVAHEKDRARKEDMDRRSEELAANIDGFKNVGTGGNKPIEEQVGPGPDEDVPF
jgi:hypothetical protein